MEIYLIDTNQLKKTNSVTQCSVITTIDAILPIKSIVCYSSRPYEIENYIADSDFSPTRIYAVVQALPQTVEWDEI